MPVQYSVGYLNVYMRLSQYNQTPIKKLNSLQHLYYKK